jgi:hypothetical protein
MGACIYAKGALFDALFRERELPIPNLNSMYGAGIHTYGGITLVADMVQHFFELWLNLYSRQFGVYFSFIGE